MERGIEYTSTNEGHREELREILKEFKTNYLPMFLGKMDSNNGLTEQIRGAELSRNLSTQAEIYLKVYQAYGDETLDEEPYQICSDLTEILEKSQL